MLPTQPPAELNAAIRVLVVELNARQMRGFGSSRAELFAPERIRPQAALDHGKVEAALAEIVIEALISHPAVRRINFTGSTRAPLPTPMRP